MLGLGPSLKLGLLHVISNISPVSPCANLALKIFFTEAKNDRENPNPAAAATEDPLGAESSVAMQGRDCFEEDIGDIQSVYRVALTADGSLNGSLKRRRMDQLPGGIM